MVTATQAIQVAKTPEWRARAEFFRIEAAVAVMAELIATPNHAERVTYAKLVLGGERGST